MIAAEPKQKTFKSPGQHFIDRAKLVAQGSTRYLTLDNHWQRELLVSTDFKFITLASGEPVPLTGAGLVVLGYDDWDDWFEFETTYNAYLFDEAGKRHRLGGIKIGEAGQTSRRANLPREFTKLPANFFQSG